MALEELRQERGSGAQNASLELDPAPRNTSAPQEEKASHEPEPTPQPANAPQEGKQGKQEDDEEEDDDWMPHEGPEDESDEEAEDAEAEMSEMVSLMKEEAVVDQAKKLKEGEKEERVPEDEHSSDEDGVGCAMEDEEEEMLDDLLLLEEGGEEELQEADCSDSDANCMEECDPDEFIQFIVQRDVAMVQTSLSMTPRLLAASDSLERTPLQIAALKGFPDILQLLLSISDRDLLRHALKEKNRYGDSLLHYALSLARIDHVKTFALECVKLLIKAEADLNAVNKAGRSVLHLACLQGNSDVLDTLLIHQADPSLVDSLGNRPLHYAIDSHSRHCIETMLIASNSELFTGADHLMYRVIESQAWEAVFLMEKHAWPTDEVDMPRVNEFVHACGLSREWEFVQRKRSSFVGLDATCSLEDFDWPLDIFKPACTAMVTHLSCIKHGAMPHDVDDLWQRQAVMKRVSENPHRLEILCGSSGILRSDMFRELKWKEDPPIAPFADLLRVHEYSYLQKLKEAVEKVPSGMSVPSQSDVLRDAWLSKETWEAARRACGCVLEAVDLIMAGEARNAFCAVRPPGHHLGPQGAVNKQLDDEDQSSQGFCLLNNVAVGAAYAMGHYRTKVTKVAIIDFDVHHGNGTEAIVRNIKEDRWSLRSRHVQHRISLGGNGDSLSAQLMGVIKVEKTPTCKPWLDPESDPGNIFFASIHGYQRGFYPGSGESCNETLPRVINVALPPRSDSVDFREALNTDILPALESFNPDIIFLSAGFDAHSDDPIGNCSLSDEDYVWLTRRFVSIANQCCNGRLISTLEGGYNTLAENVSPLALSVAGHVRTLLHTPQNYCTPPEAVTPLGQRRSLLKRPTPVLNDSPARKVMRMASPESQSADTTLWPSAAELFGGGCSDSDSPGADMSDDNGAAPAGALQMQVAPALEHTATQSPAAESPATDLGVKDSIASSSGQPLIAVERPAAETGAQGPATVENSTTASAYALAKAENPAAERVSVTSVHDAGEALRPNTFVAEAVVASGEVAQAIIPHKDGGVPTVNQDKVAPPCGSNNGG